MHLCTPFSERGAKVQGCRLTSEAQVRLTQANRRLEIGPGAAAVHCDVNRRRNGVDNVMLDRMPAEKHVLRLLPQRLLASTLGLVYPGRARGG